MSAVAADGVLESGNIAVIEATHAAMRLAIPADPGGSRHWFHVRIGPAKTPVPVRLEGLADATYAAGWPLARLWCRSPAQGWRVVPSRFDGTSLLFEHRPAEGWTEYAPTVPCHRADLVAPAGSLRTLGRSGEGRAIEVVGFTRAGRGRRQAWIVAGQHAGEMPASWFALGVIERLRDLDDPVARAILDTWDVHIVPTANPDGHAQGWQRSDARGRDLNREWSSADPAPEVAAIRDAMVAGGVDLCVDVHSDAVHPYVYIDEVDGFVGASAEAVRRRETFEAAFRTATPDFQTDRRYPWTATPARADVLRMCGPWAADHFGALGFTLELPTGCSAEGTEGWSPARSKALGRAFLEAVPTGG